MHFSYNLLFTDAVVVVTTSSSRTTSENGAEPAVVQDEALSKAHHNVCGKDLSTIESGISMRTFAPTASSQAILDSSTAEAGRAGHPALTLAEETIGRQDEKLEVPNNADLATLRHRYAFSSLKFVLGVCEVLYVVLVTLIRTRGTHVLIMCDLIT